MTNDLIEAETVAQMPAADGALVASITRAEIDTLISTARAYPRSFKQAMDRMLSLATLTNESADECIYALPRAGKAIEGPSIRFAEMAVQSWGNARVAARTTLIDKTDKFVEAEGFFLDAETNVATLARIRRRIVDSKGRIYNDDMILVTCNAAQSIARRNAILAGIPKAVWKPAYDAAHKVLMGDVKTLANRRAEALASFSRFGLTEAQVLQLMGVKGVEDIGLEQMVPLRGMYSSLLNKDITVEELLRSIEPEKPKKIGAATADLKAPSIFDDAPTAPQAKAPEAPTLPEQPKQPEPPKEVERPKEPQPSPEAEPDDRDIIVSDILQQIRLCNGNEAAMRRVLANNESDIAALDEPRRQRIREAAPFASAKRVA